MFAIQAVSIHRVNSIAGEPVNANVTLEVLQKVTSLIPIWDNLLVKQT